jgi:hypothetical protein
MTMAAVNGNANRRVVWEQELTNFHLKYAEGLVQGIAQNLKKELEDHISNPFKCPVSSDRKFIKYISLDITNYKTAKKLLGFYSPKEKPFQEWLAQFSIEPAKSENIYERNERPRGTDVGYFQDLMSIVGEVAEQKLKMLLSDYQSKSDIENLQISVKWISPYQIQSGSSNPRSNSLCVEVWFNAKAIMDKEIRKHSASTVIEGRVTKQKQTLIDQQIIKQNKLKWRKTLCETAIPAAIFVVIVLFMVVFSRSIKQLPTN